MSSPIKTFLRFSLGTWINAAVSVVSIPILTWFLLPEELGKAAMFTLCYNLLLNFFLLGQDQSYARYYNEVDDSFREGLLTQTLLSSLCFSLFNVIIIEIFRNQLSLLLFDDPRLAFYIDLLSIALLTGVINRFAQLRLRMQGRALTYSWFQILLTLINFLSTILYAVFIRNDFSAVIVSFVLSNSVCLAAIVGFERMFWRDTLNFKHGKSMLKENLNYGLPFVPTFILDWVFQSTDRTFLRLFSTFSQIGIYTTATRISASLNIIQTGFNTFWVPFAFERYKYDQTKTTFYQFTFQSLYLVFSIVILLIILFKDLIFFILPTNYHESIQLFPLVLFVPMFYTLSEITGIGINLKKKTIYHLYILIATVSVSVCMGYFLIKSYGAAGAIITNFTSYLCFFVLRTILGEKLYQLNLQWKKFIATFLIVFVPVFYVFLFPLSNSYQLATASLIAIFGYHYKLIKDLFQRLRTIRKQ